jgi:hypothetical protein
MWTILLVYVHCFIRTKLEKENYLKRIEDTGFYNILSFNDHR